MDILRSILQPITHNLPAPIAEAASTLLGPVCYQTLVLDIDPFSSPECIKLAISKALGIGIVLVSSIVKVPQIIKLVASESAAGLSLPSILLETASYLISLAYNVRHGFPFSTYGETALLSVQDIVIAALVLSYSGRTVGAGIFIALLAVVAGALFQERAVNAELLAYLQAAAGLLSVASKVPQIYTIWKEGSTGQLSAFAVFNYLGGSLSRIFTTLQEVDDKLILYGFVAGFVLNAVLAAQMVLYWNKSPAAGQKKSAGKAKGKAEKTTSSPAAGTKSRKPATRRQG
ncbi:mannose-P-dolichol utilization defect 1 protein [Xylona heveae TC161]|uniref:Mannose-P-dolichol utilization defect 1 protein homolog n=1 Tax=Xylona heveae (strain CBS 132557 / TC161) TaxID=1328760 RepID=A0A165JGK2_XYLHT|nr:mannose-P-dolichol utilization defect 1 protein [Xylona heveae TC161]KZF26209.1 mannose-P-dolichol utilization defect 1 protein [Xylona heveae TC161]